MRTPDQDRALTPFYRRMHHEDGGLAYTPYLDHGVRYPGEMLKDGRARMRVTVEDAIRIDSANPTVADRKRDRNSTEFTDLATNTRWITTPAPCGAGCYCAAVVRPAAHDARPDDDPEPGDRCKDCGAPITWNGPSQTDWSHVYEEKP